MNTKSIIQTGLAYAKSLYSFHTDGKPRPFSASYAITNRCNLKCVYCDLPNIKRQELTLDQIDLMFNKLKKMGIMRLGLFGGEPMIRKDLGEIVQLARKYKFFISLNSNLLLYSKFAEQLSDVEYFFTSIDGVPEKHILNRGNQKISKITDAIEDIAKRKKKLTIITVITDPDKESVHYVLDLAKKFGVDVQFQQESYDSMCTGRTAPDEIENETMREHWIYIYNLKKKGYPITSSDNYLRYIINWHNYKQSSIFDNNKKCMAGSGFISIDPSGLAYPCIFVQGKFDGIDLLENDWQEKFDKKTPCTDCIVGPLLEHNLLFRKPVSATFEALKKAL